MSSAHLKANQVQGYYVKMALAVLRLSGSKAARGLYKGVISKPGPLCGALVPKNALAVTSVRQARIYGPETEQEKIDEKHHWVNERYVAIALLPIIPAAMAFPHPVMDTALTCGVFLHTYWRLCGVAEDYIHGETLPKLAQPLARIFVILGFGSMCYFNYADVGFAAAARMIFSQL